MDWLTQNWPSLLIGAAFVWMMFGRRGQAGGGCCGGASVEQSSGEPAANKPASESPGRP